MATTGASLQPIYERLNGMQRHHPLDAETFADWSMEAGDTVKVTRGGDEYEAPVHTSTLVWKGGAPKITVNSTGNEKRDALTKLERRNFGRGGGGVRVAKKQFTYEVNQEHLWYEVMDENGKVSRLSVDVDGLNHEVFDADGHVSRLQNTVNGLHHEVYDKDGKVSTLDNTVNGLNHEVYDPGGLKTTLQTHAGAFDAICTGITGTGKNAKLKVAAIQAGIDSATGASKIKLNADHVDISGDAVTLTGTSSVKLNNVLTITGNAAGFSRPVIFSQGLSVANVGNNAVNTYRLNLVGSETIELTPTTMQNAIKSASVSGNVLTLTPFIGSPITFSKATTLSGAWSGGTYTVTAKQNNIEVGTDSTHLRALTINGSVSKNGKFVSRPYKVQYGPDDEHLYDTGYSQTVSIDATSVYNDGYSDGQSSYVGRTLYCESVEQAYPGSSTKIYTFTLEGNYSFSVGGRYTVYRTSWQ